MSTEYPAKRLRGAQPGNQNAKGNRGNKNPRKNFDNRGGGAPFNNQNARRKRPAPQVRFLQQFKGNLEVEKWLEAKGHLLDENIFKDDEQRDRALYDGYLGLTPESIVHSGGEFKHGLFVVPEFAERDEDDRAA